MLELHLMLAHGKVHHPNGLHPCFAAPSKVADRNKKMHHMVAASESNELLTGSHKKSGSVQSIPSATTVPELYSVDVRYNSRSPLTYDPSTGRYLDDISTNIPLKNNKDDEKINIISRFLQSAFVPEGVTPSYYRFMRWRILQRFVNANVHVIGTQSLLMGLRGMHRSGNGGVGAVATGAAAATNWVLKDTLGKIVRMGEWCLFDIYVAM
jgi:hypothetical protein